MPDLPIGRDMCDPWAAGSYARHASRSACAPDENRVERLLLPERPSNGGSRSPRRRTGAGRRRPSRRLRRRDARAPARFAEPERRPSLPLRTLRGRVRDQPSRGDRCSPRPRGPGPGRGSARGLRALGAPHRRGAGAGRAGAGRLGLRHDRGAGVRPAEPVKDEPVEPEPAAPAPPKAEKPKRKLPSLPKGPKLSAPSLPSISLPTLKRPALPKLDLPKLDPQSTQLEAAQPAARGGPRARRPAAAARRRRRRPPRPRRPAPEPPPPAPRPPPATRAATSPQPGEPIAKASKDTEFVRESSFSLALPAGWERIEPPAGATFAAVAKDGSADATLWIKQDPKLDFPSFISQSLTQLETLAGSAQIVDRTPGADPREHRRPARRRRARGPADLRGHPAGRRPLPLLPGDQRPARRRARGRR